MADDFKYHIDHVGSLVRPGDPDVAAQLAEAARAQRRLGLSAISDGQYRRRHFASVLHDRVQGFGGASTAPVAGLFAQVAGLPPLPAAKAELTAPDRLAADEAAALLAVTQRSTVLDLPAPGFVAEGSYDPAAYASPEALGAALAAIVGAEVQALAADGIQHVRLTNPGYALAITTGGRAQLKAAGVDPDALLDRMAAADAASIANLAADETFRVSLDLTTRGRGDLTSGYHPAAVTRLFERLPFYRFHVEHPGFPLDLVPAGTVLALGIVDTGNPEPERVEDLLRIVDTAAETIDIDDIAISTNGAFLPGPLTWDQQHTKLQLVEMVARYYWGNEL